MENNNQDHIKYLEAKKKVKKIKGFYIHLLVYLAVNFIIIVSNVVIEHKGFNHLENYSMALFWGIGLLAHGLSVFSTDFIFGKNWEEKKIKEIMSKNQF